MGWRLIAHGCPLLLVLLTQRDSATAATYVVNSSRTFVCEGDDCMTLSGAIAQANNNPGPDLIEFNIPLTGVHSIGETTTIRDTLIIDGTTQPGYSPTTPMVWLFNAALRLENASGCRIRGLVISGDGLANVVITGGGDNAVEACFIGTDPTGLEDVPPPGCAYCGSGIWIGASNGNRIGGPDPTFRNIISGAGVYGVLLGFDDDDPVSGNIIEGNWIGLNLANQPLPNNGGVALQGGAHNNHIRNNVISANAPDPRYTDPNHPANGNGILLVDATTNSNDIQGNWIGLDGTGLEARPNYRHGIFIQDAFVNIIGGVTAEGNYISGNLQDGIHITGVQAERNRVWGNRIGANVDSSAAVGNQHNGVHIVNAPSTGIGDLADVSGNCIVGNLLNGILIEGATATGTHVRNNSIGVMPNGAPRGNGLNGIRIPGVANNWVGADAGETDAGNLISANSQYGILIEGEEASGNVISDNIVGLDPFGNHSDPDGVPGNGNEYWNRTGGILIDSAPETRIGTPFGNVVSGHETDPGIELRGSGTRETHVSDNIIGLNKAMTATRGNFIGLKLSQGPTGASIQSNIISGNFVGIEINGTGTSGNYIFQNVIGSDREVTRIDLGNRSDGISITDSGGNDFINNHICGNGYDQDPTNEGSGVYIKGASARGNYFWVNRIGVNKTGSEAIPNRRHGIHIVDAPANRIGDIGDDYSNQISGNQGAGVFVEGALSVDNRIHGNYIGTNGLGDEAVPNVGGGIVISDAPGMRIGATGGGNLVSGNGSVGVLLFGPGTTHTRVEGNLIGLDATGSAPLPNAGDGVGISEGSHNTVGGFGNGRRNFISGNDGDGVSIIGVAATGNRIENNYIGTDQDGQNLVGNARGIYIQDSSANVVGSGSTQGRNVISGNENGGIVITGSLAQANVVKGNYIGTDVDGVDGISNGLVGVEVDGAADTTVGGETAGAGNVISSNDGQGVLIKTGSMRTRVQGNLIGTDRTGATALPNQSSGLLTGGTQTLVGGASAAAANVISGNGVYGVFIGGPDTVLQGNRIGTDGTGMQRLPNELEGLAIHGDSENSLIGGATAGAGNIISGNEGNGIWLLETSGVTIVGNLIGTAADGRTPLPNTEEGLDVGADVTNVSVGAPSAGNVVASNGSSGITVSDTATRITIRGNQMLDNGGLAIDLAPAGTATNDPNDSDTGANEIQNHPELVALCNPDGTISVSGILQSAPNAAYLVDFYASASCDASGSGEAQEYLGFQSVITDGSGIAPIAFVTPAVASGGIITATATDSLGNTSEFSGCEVSCAGNAFAPRVASVEVFYAGRFADAGDPSRQFLAVGQTSAPSHYTNFIRGITGLRITFNKAVTFLGGAANAFSFEATPESVSDPTFSSFAPPTAPTYAVNLVRGRTIVEIRFAEREVRNRWLRVRVNALRALGDGLPLDGELSPPLTFPSGDGTADGDSVFIVGHIACEVTSDYVVLDPSDPNAVLANVNMFSTVPIENIFDVDKDGQVLASDVAMTSASTNPGFTLPMLP